MIEFYDTAIGHLALIKTNESWYETQIVIGEKNYWSKGYGTQAINLLIKRARELGINKIYLEVRPDNFRAIRTYEKCGFKRAELINYPNNPNLPQTLRMELIN